MPQGSDTVIRKKRKPNVFDVARLAGVSQTTVSFVLNGAASPRISDATSRRVHDAVAELGYRPNSLARSLAKGRTKTIGMVLPYLDDDFHGIILRECQSVLSDSGYQLLIMHANNFSGNEAGAVSYLLQHSVDGIVCFAHEYTTRLVPEWIADMRRSGVPGVILDSLKFSGDLPCVASDDIAGIDLAMQHLYDLGHRRICLLSSNWDDDLVPDRILGYDLSADRLGLSYRHKICDDKPITSDEYSEEMARLLESEDAPTAFVTYNDYSFESFLFNYVGTRFRVPEDVSLVGYANTYLSRAAKLTTVCQHPEKMGLAAAEQILARQRQPDLPPLPITIPTSLIVRQSTAPPAR